MWETIFWVAFACIVLLVSNMVTHHDAFAAGYRKGFKHGRYGGDMKGDC